MQNIQRIELLLNEPVFASALHVSSPRHGRKKASVSEKVCVVTELIYKRADMNASSDGLQ